jgi:hypothetical protein
MPIFISYNKKDSHFVNNLAANLIKNRHHIWMDRWELKVGDSLIDKIQSALTDSSAILLIFSKHSVNSEWCRMLIIAKQRNSPNGVPRSWLRRGPPNATIFSGCGIIF